MKRALGLAVAFLLVMPAFAPAADPKLDDLLGKWELTADAAGIPKGSIFDFHKDGKLVIVATVKDEKKTLDLKFKLKEKDKLLEFTIGDKTDTTEVVSLTKTDLVCKDKDGITAKFKRPK